MAALHTLALVLALTVAAVRSAAPGPAYDFDYRRHLAGLNDPAPVHGQHDHHGPHDHDAHGPTGCHCANHDGHHHGHDLTERGDGDQDDDEVEAPRRGARNAGCGLCGGDHSDANHHKHHTHAHAGPGSHHGHQEKHYRLRVGMDMPKTGYLYRNEAGRLEGFLLDLIANVCRTAGKVCHPVNDLKERCWESSTDSPGTGLVSGWYDGCVGFFPTPEKYDAFDFSTSFSLNPILALHFPTNRVPNDPTFIGRKKIGFVRSLPMNAACIRRLAAFRGNFNAVEFDSMPQLVKALAANKIDAFPWMANFTEPRMPAVQSGPTFTCTSQGLSVMARKGDPLVTWWDEAYQKVVEVGAYGALCSKALEQPGWKGRVYCLEA